MYMRNEYSGSLNFKDAHLPPLYRGGNVSISFEHGPQFKASEPTVLGREIPRNAIAPMNPGISLAYFLI